MTRLEKYQFWLNHIEAWSRSELSQAEYTRQHALSIKSFAYYKRRYGTEPEPPPRPQLVPVVMPEENSADSILPPGSGITLTSPGGFRLELPTDFDESCLRRILQVVQ